MKRDAKGRKSRHLSGGLLDFHVKTGELLTPVDQAELKAVQDAPGLRDYLTRISEISARIENENPLRAILITRLAAAEDALNSADALISGLNRFVGTLERELQTVLDAHGEMGMEALRQLQGRVEAMHQAVEAQRALQMHPSAAAAAAARKRHQATNELRVHAQEEWARDKGSYDSRADFSRILSKRISTEHGLQITAGQISDVWLKGR